MEFNLNKFDEIYMEEMNADKELLEMSENDCGELNFNNTNYLVLPQNYLDKFRELVNKSVKRYIESD